MKPPKTTSPQADLLGALKEAGFYLVVAYDTFGSPGGHRTEVQHTPKELW